MTITHHPSEATLAAFASGTLDEGRSAVVAAHVSRCPHCQGTMKTFEFTAGALLHRTPPSALRDDALERAISAIGTGVGEASSPQLISAPAESGIPAPLAAYGFGPWRWIGFGVQWRSVDVPVRDGVRVFMLKAAPGTHLPHHRHAGMEWTCVLEGAFRHDLGRYGPGDFDEADETVEHTPVIEAGPHCVCLVAMQGNIELQGWVGRLLQPFVRI